MNLKKRGNNSGKSGFLRNTLFGIIGHVRNPFSMNPDNTSGVEAHKCDKRTRKELEAAYLEAEILRIKASIVAQNIIARFQKS